MKNYVQPGNIITTPAPAAVTSGQGVVVGSLFGVASQSVTIGERFDLALEGIYTLPKVSALAIAIGDVVYWNDTTKLVTKITTDKKIGIAVTAAANPSGTVNIRLIPTI